MAGSVGAALSGPGPGITGDPSEREPPLESGSALRKAGSMVQGWHDWLTEPGNRAMLIQSGINMLQPHAPGQSQIGHTAAAIGSGFEARDTLAQTQNANAMAQQKLDIEQQTADDLGLYRSAQADRYKALGASVSGKGDNTRSMDIKTYLAAVKMDEVLGKEIQDRTLVSDLDNPDPEIASLQAQRDANRQFVAKAQAAIEGAIGTKSGTGAATPATSAATPGGATGEGAALVARVKATLASRPGDAAYRSAIIDAAKKAAVGIPGFDAASLDAL